ncbi:MAG: RNA-binding protein [Verrucomicrobiota bacterium]
MNIYVGNLPYSVTEAQIHGLFNEHGSIDKINIIMDHMTGKSKGFAFVEMSVDAEGQAAIDAIDGTSLDGRSIKVNEARPREERPPRQFNGGGGDRRGGGGGGDRRGGGGQRRRY